MSFDNTLTARFGARWKKQRGKRGVEYRVCCPFCPRNRGKVDKEFKLYMNPQVGVYNCYKCSARGSLSEMFKDFRNIDYNPFQAPAPVRPQGAIKMPGDVVPLAALDPSHVARRYMEGRGFNTEVLTHYFGVHYCSSGTVYKSDTLFFDTTNTIVFPVWMNKQIVGWQARVMFDPDKLDEDQCAAYGFPLNEEGEFMRPPKYMTSPGMSKGNVLYNYDNARQSRVVVVSEGPLDVAGVGMCGVGTFGKGVSEMQLRLLKQYWDLVVVLLDPGDADSEMHAMMSSLRCSLPAVQVNLKGAKDPGDSSFELTWMQIYDTVAAAGFNLHNYNLGPWNAAIARTKVRT